MARNITHLALMAVALTGSAQAATAQETVIGILEEQPSETEAKPIPYVRAVFRKAGGTWTAYDPACPKGSCFRARPTGPWALTARPWVRCGA